MQEIPLMHRNLSTIESQIARKGVSNMKIWMTITPPNLLFHSSSGKPKAQKKTTLSSMKQDTQFIIKSIIYPDQVLLGFLW